MTKYTKSFAESLKEVRTPKVVKEDYEVSMAIGQLKTIQDRVGKICLLYTSPSPRDSDSSRMPSSA